MPPSQWMEQFVRDYGDTVFRICFLCLKDYQLAEDAAQETFLRALISYETFEHQSSVKTWLVRIAVNCCRNIIRTRWFRLVCSGIEEGREGSENSIEEWIERISISDAIRELAGNDREIILLFYYQGLSLKEIAAALGISENAANQRLYRARKRLKKILRKEEWI